MNRRLALLLVALGLAAAARAHVELRVVPLVQPPTMSPQPSRKLSRADKAKLEGLQTRSVHERDEYLKLKNAGAPADQVRAQYQRVVKAVEAVHAIGGTEAIRVLPVSKYAPASEPGGSGKAGAPGGPK